MAFLVWGLLGCSGVYWLIQLAAKPLATPAQALPAAERTAPGADLSRLLGAPLSSATAAPAPAVESRFKLLGVVAPSRSARSAGEQGVALIAVDGVARTVRVGALLEGDLRLLKLDGRSAGLGAGNAITVTLELAPPGAAATGTLAPAAPSPVNLGGPVPSAGPTLPPVELREQAPQVDNQGRPLS